MKSKSRSSSPPIKRAKLEFTSPERQGAEENEDLPVPDDLGEDHCAICLQEVMDRTMIPACSHDLFCFECLMIWTEQSRRCPLCSQNIGDHIIHNYRSRYDYQKHYLPPLRTSSPKALTPIGSRPGPLASRRFDRRRRIPREVRERSRREREERDEADRFERALAKRKWIYRHDLYAKHVASNSYTRFRPFPTPAQFAASPDLISRTTSFLRRELLVWMDLDVEFLTTFIISLMKAIDIRSESTVKLLAEFLDMDAPYVEGGRHVNAEHFAHEVYSYVRSPYKDLFVYDTVVQYETSPNIGRPTPPHRPRKSSRQRSRSPLSRGGRRGRSRSRSMSWSPSGRQYLRLPSPESARYEAGSPGNFVRRSPSIDIPSSHPMVSAANDRSVTPSQAAQNLGHDESHHSSPEGKGKAVAHDLVLSDAAESVKQSMVPSTLTTSLASKRPPRLLDLQTSIQAHLEGERGRIPPPLQIKGRALSSRSLSKAGIVPSLKIKGREKPSLSSQSSPPSLLSRISGTHLGEKSNPVTAALSSPRLSNDHSRHPHPRDEDGGQLTSYEPRTLPFSPEHLSPMNALSGLHDTQDTQSRARDDRSMTKKIKKSVAVAKKLDANEGSSTSAFLTKVYRSASNDSEGPIDNPHVDSGLAYGGRMNGEVLGSDPRPSSVQVQGSHTTVSTLNMRLLHKLEEEKRHLQDNNLSATLFNSEDLTDVFVGRNTAVVTDPHAMEAKLRARAQLKMRLASEKGNLASPK